METLSVIVTIMSGRYLERCLHSLIEQRNSTPLEIIVPFFPAEISVSRLIASFHGVRFIEIPEQPPQRRGFRHWKYDRSRAVGVTAARGSHIAMTDEYAIPAATWCQTLLKHHLESGNAVTGGAIRLRASGPLAQAAFLCDFERFLPPFEAGSYGFASLSNACFRREALERCSSTWRDFFDESVVNLHIAAAGGRIALDPTIVVEYAPPSRPTRDVLIGKYESGRTFAGRRAAAMERSQCIEFGAGSVILPLVLFKRKLAGLWRKNRFAGIAPASLPLLLLCLIAWSAGELTGYLTQRPFPRINPAKEARATA